MRNHKFKDPNVNLYIHTVDWENFTVKNNYTVETNCEKLNMNKNIYTVMINE